MSIIIVVKAVHVTDTGVGGENGETELAHEFAIIRAFYTSVEINILIFSLGRYAHRALLTRVEKNQKEK